jgi:hypothetical protein
VHHHWRIDVGVDVRALTGVSVVFACAPSSRRRRGVGSGLLCGGPTVLPFAVSLAALFLHQDLLRCRLWCWPQVAGPVVLSKLPVEFGQLLVKLVPGLGNLGEARPALVSVARWCGAGSRVIGAAQG